MKRLDEKIQTLPIVRFREGKQEELTDLVIKESVLSIFLNHHKLVSLICSPDHYQYLAVGFLLSEGIIQSPAEIKSITIEESCVLIEAELQNSTLEYAVTIASGCGKGVTFHRALEVKKERHFDFLLSPETVSRLMKEFEQSSHLFKITGGVHAAAVANNKEILIFHEDLSRHNALDKVLGECWLENISLQDKIVLLSGRVSSEILLKVARTEISVVISHSAVTNLAVELAEKVGITLLGFARGRRINVYSHPQRIRNFSEDLTF